MTDRNIVPAVFTVKEAAQYLRIAISTVYKMVRAGTLTHTQVGKCLRFRREDLDTYLAENTGRKYRRMDKRGRPPTKC